MHLRRKQQDEVPVLQEFQKCLIRDIQEHTGGNLIAPDVAIPYNWKEVLCHRGCSYDVQSMLRSGLIAGGRESKEGRQTIFFTPLNPIGENPDEEEPSDDLSKPRKVHFHSKWKTGQDAVFWMNLVWAQDKGPTVLANQIPCHNCIQLCDSRLHLQGEFSQWGKNFIWETLDASSCTEDSTQECLAIAAAATSAARHIGECCFGHQETGAKRGTR